MAIRSETNSLFTIGIFSNKPLIFSVILSLFLQMAITYVPFLQPIFQTEALTLAEFLVVGSLALFVLIAVEAEKMFIRYKRKNKK
jgi:Ca2+-transporting ATPase